MKEIHIPYHAHVRSKKPVDHFLDETNPDFTKPFAIGNTWLEKKSDGNRVLVSYDRSNKHEPIKIFSNSGIEWNPQCFPDIVADVKTLPNSCVLPGEILGYATHDNFTKEDEFSAISNRPKLSASNLTAEDLKERPLTLDVFDILRIEDTVLAGKPLHERRTYLESLIRYETNRVQPIEHWDVTTVEGMANLYTKMVKGGSEGLIAKNPDSLYIPGTRNRDWMKLKDFTTLDLAVLGFYETQASVETGKEFSAILVGSYNDQSDQYETMVKVAVRDANDREAILQNVSMVPTGRNFSYVQ